MNLNRNLGHGHMKGHPLILPLFESNLIFENPSKNFPGVCKCLPSCYRAKNSIFPSLPK